MQALFNIDDMQSSEHGFKLWSTTANSAASTAFSCSFPQYQ